MEVERSKKYVQGYRNRGLHGTFGEKTYVKYVSERTLALCSKTSAFFKVSYLSLKVF